MCSSLCNIAHVNWRMKVMTVATNLEIDKKLIDEALKLGNQKTKRAVVEEALKEYVERRKQREIIKLFGSIEYENDYDYKEQRKKK